MRGVKTGVTQSMGSIQDSAIKIAGAIAALFAFRRLFSGLTKAVELLRTQESAEQRLRAVIRATGKAAGFTAEELFKEASALQRVTTQGDETVIATQAIIASFKNIKGDEFRRVTELAADLAVLMGTDMKAAAIQLAKALNAPDKNLSALSRSGIQFTKEQEDMIKVLFKSGRMVESQAIILAELETQMGGTARAVAEGSGEVDQMANQIGDMKEVIGKQLLPVMLKWKEIQIVLISFIQKIIEFVKENAAAIKLFAVAVGGAVLALKLFQLATKAAAASKAILLSLSGRKGMILLAKAATAGAIAVATVNAAFEAVEASAKSAMAEAKAESVAAIEDEKTRQGLIDKRKKKAEEAGALGAKLAKKQTKAEKDAEKKRIAEVKKAEKELADFRRGERVKTLSQLRDEITGINEAIAAEKKRAEEERRRRLSERGVREFGLKQFRTEIQARVNKQDESARITNEKIAKLNEKQVGLQGKLVDRMEQVNETLLKKKGVLVKGR
jgi:hypothetical protein